MTATLVAGGVGAWLFVAVFLVDGVTRPGYDPVRHPVSALALGSRGWLQTANFVVGGVLITTSALGIQHATSSLWLAGAVAVFGLGLIASGVFPMDPMRGYPPGTPDGDPPTTSRRHRLHDHAGAVVFGSLPIAAVVAVLTLDETVWSVASGIVAVVFAVASSRFATAWERDDPRTGLLQRFAMVPGWLWLGGLCLHLATRS